MTRASRWFAGLIGRSGRGRDDATPPDDVYRPPGERLVAEMIILDAPEEKPPPFDASQAVADLQRLSAEIDRLLGDDTIFARGRRLIAYQIAYDVILLQVCRALRLAPWSDLPAFRRLEPTDRLLVEGELARCGLRW